MTFLGAILEHFGLHFGTKNGQKHHQNMSMKKVKKKELKKKTFLDMGTGSAICLETLARTRLSMTDVFEFPCAGMRVRQGCHRRLEARGPLNQK